MVKSPTIPLVHKLLFAWYSKNKRDLPWRKCIDSSGVRDPYRITVSELMLQQTQVVRVLPKFEAFIQQWPTVESLSQASLAQVLIAWSGLGYNRRAKYLLESAKIIVTTYNGKFPNDSESLSKLPGFGEYMVRALRVFAFGFQDAVIDVNVSRVLSRIFIGGSTPKKQEIKELARQLIPTNKSDQWHQALMDFGSLVCFATPDCEKCPLKKMCRANQESLNTHHVSYGVWLSTQPKVRKVSRKDVNKKFEETDRYFRGRIIEYLRSGATPMEKLQKHIVFEKKLHDRARFGRLIEQLVIDGLLKITGSTVLLMDQ